MRGPLIRWPVSSSTRVEAGALDQLIDRAIEMAAAREAAPHGGQAVLPARHARLRRAPMLDEQEAAARAQHAPDLRERAQRVGDAAQGPAHHHVVDRGVAERDVFGPPLAQLDREMHPHGVSPGDLQQLARRVEAEQQLDVARVERQVEPGADPDLEHPAARPRDQLLAQRRQLLLAHAEVDQPGHDALLVEAQFTSAARTTLRRRRVLG